MANDRLVWEQRRHPFRDEWILYTSHRSGRPWSGETKPPEQTSAPDPDYDPNCYLCPGNERITGRNPNYQGVYVFANDLPTFSSDAPKVCSENELHQVRRAVGAAEVICYHPNHTATFSDLTSSQASAVAKTWQERSRILSARSEVSHVLIFENKGSIVGTSNPHPHCQLYAGNLIYAISERERIVARRFQTETGRLLGLAVAESEADSERVVCENKFFLACVPWFARYAYEVLILPKIQVATLSELSDNQVESLALLMREVTIRYDNLWQMKMPYVMAIHQAPCDGENNSSYPFHVEYHPPLRTPDTLKYLAGPEIGGGSMTNESNPDEKASELRAVSSILYRNEGFSDE